MAATPSLSPAADGPLPSRRTDAAADRNSSAAPGRGARRVLRLATQRLAIARSHSTDTRKVDAEIEASLEEMTPSSARVHPDAPDTTSSPGQMKTRHLLRHIQRRSPGYSANSRRRGSGTPARSRLMRGESPAAETDHVWAAAAHISPLCKVAGPSMINSTGEPNGGYARGYHRVVSQFRYLSRPTVGRHVPARSEYLYIGSCTENARFCRDPRVGVSQPGW